MRDELPLCQAIALYTAADHRSQIDKDQIGMTYWDAELVDEMEAEETDE
jgi:hypothetical protein